MKLVIAVAVAVAGVCACHRDREAPASAPAVVKAPVRGAAGDEDLRVMLAEIASAHACEMFRGHFEGLKGTDRPDITTGVLWIRDCKITSDGTRVTMELFGNGWQWANQTKHEAGGTFVVKQYVKFAVTAKLTGALDIAYDRTSHVVSLWFSPARAPDISFEPIGGVDVDRKGLWSSVIGALSSVVADSPDEQGEHQAKQQGTKQFENQLGQGMTAAVDLCTGYLRFTIGRPPKGSLGPLRVGESIQKTAELEPGGVLVFGPQLAPDGMSVDIEVSGRTRIALACEDQAARVAEAFVHQQPDHPVDVLAERDLVGRGSLRTKPVRCKVAVIARSLDAQPIQLAWRRPHGEQARATGGPLIHCARPGAALSSPADGAARPAAPRR